MNGHKCWLHVEDFVYVLERQDISGTANRYDSPLVQQNNLIGNFIDPSHSSR